MNVEHDVQIEIASQYVSKRGVQILCSGASIHISTDNAELLGVLIEAIQNVELKWFLEESN